MMKVLIYGALFCASVSVSVHAQKSPINFGDVSLEDFKMISYDKDPSAPAVILTDFGKTYMRKNQIIFDRHVRIKILKTGGVSWADVSIPLYNGRSGDQSVTNIKAVTYNLEGGKVTSSSMGKEAIFKEVHSKYLNVQKFSLPNVREGSVIEYSYTIVSDFINLPNWQFQYTIPVRHSEYWAIIPEEFTYEKYMLGYVPISSYDVNRAGYAQAHHWISLNVPAFKEEPFMTNKDDYISKINFALSYIQFDHQTVQEVMGTWDALNKDLLNHERFGKTITGSNYLKKQVEIITKDKTESFEKIEAIYNYIKQTIEWNGVKSIVSEDLSDVFKTKKGSSGDINLALASMLEKANLKVEMVLLSTRDHGFIRKQSPMRSQFNYVICGVWSGDNFILLDATDKFLPIDALPEYCFNGDGLVVTSANQEWINIEPKTKAKTLTSADLVMDPKGELRGKLHLDRYGYDAQQMRKNYTSKGEENYVYEFTNRKNWKVEKTEFINVSSLSKSVQEIHNVSISEHASVVGDYIYISPFIISQLEQNPFKSEKRLYPIDFGSKMEKTYLLKLKLPEGYVTEEIPPAIIFSLPENAGRYVYNSTSNGDLISITTTFQINKILFEQNEYASLREFYNLVVSKQSEQIVLKKRTK